MIPAITVSDPLPRPLICIACAEGDHEQALRAHEHCTCPCHGEPFQAVEA